MSDMTAERIARNEAVFRDANEGIRGAAEEHGVPERVPFLCECADGDCTEIVRLSLDEYEHVRTDGTWFLNAPGHQTPFGESVEVVEQRDGYLIAAKVGRAGEIAAELDPRKDGD